MSSPNTSTVKGTMSNHPKPQYSSKTDPPVQVDRLGTGTDTTISPCEEPVATSSASTNRGTRSANADRLRSKVGDLLKEAFKRIELMAATLLVLQDSAHTSPGHEGPLKLITRHMTSNEVVELLNVYRMRLQGLQQREAWLLGAYDSFRAALLTHQPNGSHSSISEVLPSMSHWSPSIPMLNAEGMMELFERANPHVTDRDGIPLLNTAVASSDLEYLRQENDELSSAALNLRAKLDRLEGEVRRQNADIGRLVREQEARGAQWSRESLRLKDKIQSLQAELEEKTQLSIISTEDTNPSQSGNTDVHNASGSVPSPLPSPNSTESHVSIANMRHVMRYQAQLEAKVESLLKNENRLQGELRLLKASHDDKMKSLCEGTETGNPGQTSPILSNDEAQLKGQKFDYIQTIFKQYKAFEEKGSHDKALLVLPAIQRALELE